MILSGFPWWLMIPEFGLTALILLTLIGELWLPDHQKRWLNILNGCGLLWLIGCAMLLKPGFDQLFHDFYVIDNLSSVLRIFFLTAALLILLMSREHSPGGPQERGPFLLLLLLSTLGMVFTASSGDLLTLFLSVELVTFSFYVMIAYLRTDLRSVEAGLKYLILGGASSAITLFGIALVYAGTGTTGFSALSTQLAVPSATGLCFAGLTLIVGGLSFKVAMVPFHMWVPDVYQGAPTSVAAFLSIGSKAAGCAALLRVVPLLLTLDRPRGIALLAAGSALTLLYGNLAALPQKNLRRLLGYSSIGHTGYLLMALMSPTLMGAKALVYYLFAYLFATGLAFYVIAAAQGQTEGDDIEHFNGLAIRSPLLGASLFVSFMSLAGVPPLAGFFGKFLMLNLLVREGMLWLAVLGALMVPISLYYYLMVIKAAYANEPSTTQPILVSSWTRVSLAVGVIALLLLGIFQKPLYQLVAGQILNF